MKMFFTVLALIAGLLGLVWAINYFITGNSYGNISYWLYLILIFSTVGACKSKKKD